MHRLSIDQSCQWVCRCWELQISFVHLFTAADLPYHWEGREREKNESECWWRTQGCYELSCWCGLNWVEMRECASCMLQSLFFSLPVSAFSTVDSMIKCTYSALLGLNYTVLWWVILSALTALWVRVGALACYVTVVFEVIALLQSEVSIVSVARMRLSCSVNL